MGENLLGLVLDSRRAKMEGSEGMIRRPPERLVAMMAFARANSPFYRRLYVDVPEGFVGLEHPPIRVEADMRSLLERHGLGHVPLERGDEPPQQTQSGKACPITSATPKGPNP
jgi:hypothetical protein